MKYLNGVFATAAAIACLGPVGAQAAVSIPDWRGDLGSPSVSTRAHEYVPVGRGDKWTGDDKYNDEDKDYKDYSQYKDHDSHKDRDKDQGDRGNDYGGGGNNHGGGGNDHGGGDKDYGDREH
jgi:hypothetical protein